jgi:hypothetical protein
MVIEMEDPRCTIAASEMEDPRCMNLCNGMVIGKEDLRCKSLLSSAVTEMEDPRCGTVAHATEDPRCRSLHIW